MPDNRTAMTLASPLEELKIFTKPQIAALKKSGLTAIRDVLLYFPYRYLDFSKTAAIADLKPDENISLKV
ncbi:MAG TPA: hypothetical protein VHA30_03485, partial [Patescibacteria group bacterium]|nr:hypothetical protein [Patescibacteria group bacterium]